MYFNMHSYCHYVSTAHNACIYNVASGDLIKLEPHYKNFLDHAMQGKAIEESCKDIYETLVAHGIGRVGNQPVLYRPFEVGKPLELLKGWSYRKTVTTFFVELSNECTLDCSFCGKLPTSFRKTGCRRWNYKNTLSLHNYIDAIDQVSKLGCKEIVFIGGEPLLHFELVKSIVSYANKKGIHKFQIFTNGYRVSDEQIEFLQQNKFKIILHILGFTDDIAEIVGVIDYIDSLEIFLNKMKGHGLRASILIGRFNEKTVNATVSKLQALSFDLEIMTSYIYPTQKKDAWATTKVVEHNFDPADIMFSHIDALRLTENKKKHVCFGHSLTLLSNGAITPCPMMPRHILGSIYDSSIYEILSTEDYNEYETLTKDKIYPCNLCAFRYGCHDCRAIEPEIKKMTYCHVAQEIISTKKHPQANEKVSSLFAQIKDYYVFLDQKRDLIEKASNTLFSKAFVSDKEFFIAAFKELCKFQDYHIDLTPPTDALHRLVVPVIFYNRKCYYQDINGLVEILSVNGHEINNLFDGCISKYLLKQYAEITYKIAFEMGDYITLVTNEQKVINMNLAPNAIIQPKLEIDSHEELIKMVNHESIHTDQTGYIRINSFGNYSYYKWFSESLDLIKENKILVLDVRTNKGGNIEIAKKVLSRLISDRIVLFYSRERNEKSSTELSDPKPVTVSPLDSVKFEKIIVLTSEYTCSSSETILINGLKKYYGNDCVLLGEKTAGFLSEALETVYNNGMHFTVTNKIYSDIYGAPIFTHSFSPDIACTWSCEELFDYKERRKSVELLLNRINDEVSLKGV